MCSAGLSCFSCCFLKIAFGFLPLCLKSELFEFYLDFGGVSDSLAGPVVVVVEWGGLLSRHAQLPLATY